MLPVEELGPLSAVQITRTPSRLREDYKVVIGVAVEHYPQDQVGRKVDTCGTLKHRFGAIIGGRCSEAE